MTFVDFLLWKGIGLMVLAFLVCFIYRLFTGRSLTEERNDKQQD